MNLLRDLLVFVFALAGWPADAEPGGHQSALSPSVQCGGALAQGGLVICQGPPGAVYEWQGGALRADEYGLAMFGLRRDAPEILEVKAELPSGQTWSEQFPIAPRDDMFRVIEGLDCDKVDARTPQQKDHAARSWVKKQEAFADFRNGSGAMNGFSRPAEGPTSSPFGPARKYIGVSAETGEPCDKVSVHRGYDIAAPVGTGVTAPATGTVILADPDLYYEGGTIFLDHGYGLVSVFMHLSQVDVLAGEDVQAGQRIGAVGNTGRTTGPHLHWAVKWRDAQSQDRRNDFYIDPALLLELDLSAFDQAADERTQSSGSEPAVSPESEGLPPE